MLIIYHLLNNSVLSRVQNRACAYGINEMGDAV